MSSIKKCIVEHRSSASRPERLLFFQSEKQVGPIALSKIKPDSAKENMQSFGRNFLVEHSASAFPQFCLASKQL
jgi:hypothetical protein